MVYARPMHSDHLIQLSGPFSVTDSLGRTWDLNGIRIFDEGYGIIDVYVDFVTSMDDEPLYEDPRVIGQILARLRMLGYDGPDFGHGDLGLQDDRVIVLEAPEEFSRFAASKGWRNLAEEYADEGEDDATTRAIIADPEARAAFFALMHKLGVK